MKQILRLLAIIVTLSACSKDSDTSSSPPGTNNPPPTTEKCRIKHYKDILYTYDTQGRVLTMVGVNGEIEYSYSGQTVTVTNRTTSPYTIHTATLNSQGYITYWDNTIEKNITTATYTPDGYVTEIVKKDYDGHLLSKETFTIEGGNVTARTETTILGTQSETISYSCQYDKAVENVGNVRYYTYEADPMLQLFHKPIKNLLAKETESKLSRLYTYKYTRDSKGLPTSLQILENGNSILWRLYDFECK